MDGDDQQQARDREREPSNDRAARCELELGDLYRCEPGTSEQHQQESQLGQPATSVMSHQDDHARQYPSSRHPTLEARLTRLQGWELIQLIDREQPAETLELKLGEVVPYAQPP
jgi:hypothetical protein